MLLKEPSMLASKNEFHSNYNPWVCSFPVEKVLYHM